MDRMQLGPEGKSRSMRWNRGFVSWRGVALDRRTKGEKLRESLYVRSDARVTMLVG